jgi:hypothetical protein
MVRTLHGPGSQAQPWPGALANVQFRAAVRPRTASGASKAFAQIQPDRAFAAMWIRGRVNRPKAEPGVLLPRTGGQGVYLGHPTDRSRVRHGVGFRCGSTFLWQNCRCRRDVAQAAEARSSHHLQHFETCAARLFFSPPPPSSPPPSCPRNTELARRDAQRAFAPQLAPAWFGAEL